MCWLAGCLLQAAFVEHQNNNDTIVQHQQNMNSYYEKSLATVVVVSVRSLSFQFNVKELRQDRAWRVEVPYLKRFAVDNPPGATSCDQEYIGL